jgi:hypothetical protein
VEPNFLPAARFSLRRCLSVFCGCFFCSFFGFAAPFIMTSQPTRTRCHTLPGFGSLPL